MILLDELSYLRGYCCAIKAHHKQLPLWEISFHLHTHEGAAMEAYQGSESYR